MNVESNEANNYIEIDKKIERMSELIYFVLIKICLLGAMLPALLMTTVNYFVYNLGEESFYLPAPVM